MKDVLVRYNGHGVFLAERNHRKQITVVDGLQDKHDHSGGQQTERECVAVLAKNRRCDDRDSNCECAVRKKEEYGDLDLKRMNRRVFKKADQASVDTQLLTRGVPG